MNELTIKSPGECRFDEVSLGEVMLRLDPGEGRIHTTRTFAAWEGGGEYNVARGLRQQFGEEYRTYCKNVPRWMPRVIPYKPSH